MVSKERIARTHSPVAVVCEKSPATANKVRVLIPVTLS